MSGSDLLWLVPDPTLWRRARAGHETRYTPKGSACVPHVAVGILQQRQKSADEGFAENTVLVSSYCLNLQTEGHFSILLLVSCPDSTPHEEERGNARTNIHHCTFILMLLASSLKNISLLLQNKTIKKLWYRCYIFNCCQNLHVNCKLYDDQQRPTLQGTTTIKNIMIRHLYLRFKLAIQAIKITL